MGPPNTAAASLGLITWLGAPRRRPACRVCGCTEGRACLIQNKTGTTSVGCSWVPVEDGSRPLCNACAGTAADLAEVLYRFRALKTAPTFPGGARMIRSALARYRERKTANQEKNR